MGARLLHRAVGMRDFMPLEVWAATTSRLEFLRDQPLRPGSVVTILVKPQDEAREHYRMVGVVERREQRAARWLHVVRASSSQPWPPVFVYDLTYHGVDPAASSQRDSPVSRYTPANEEYRRRSAGAPAPAETPRIDPVVYRALARLAPFNKLNDLLRRVIARENRLTRKPAGATLIKRGDRDDLAVCLISGILELEEATGKKSYVVGRTHSARFPVSMLRPHAYTVRALSDVTVILLSQETVRKVLRILAAHEKRLKAGLTV